jgi:polyhydroxyalkanoate synthesis repressor PhaR
MSGKSTKTVAAEDSDGVRVLKKYPNRRIYDTHQSAYINLDDVKKMVLDGIDFKVVDSKSNTDLTRSVLLQLIIEQESESNPLFSAENLKSFIHYYDQNQQQLFSEYLNQSLSFFQKQQKQFNQGMQDMIAANPMKLFSEYSKRNTQMWQKMQKSFFSDTSKKDD